MLRGRQMDTTAHDADYEDFLRDLVRPAPPPPARMAMHARGDHMRLSPRSHLDIRRDGIWISPRWHSRQRRGLCSSSRAGLGDPHSWAWWWWGLVVVVPQEEEPTMRGQIHLYKDDDAIEEVAARKARAAARKAAQPQAMETSASEQLPAVPKPAAPKPTAPKPAVGKARAADDSDDDEAGADADDDDDSDGDDEYDDDLPDVSRPLPRLLVVMLPCPGGGGGVMGVMGMGCCWSLRGL